MDEAFLDLGRDVRLLQSRSKVCSVWIPQRNVDKQDFDNLRVVLALDLLALKTERDSQSKVRDITVFEGVQNIDVHLLD